MAFKTMLYALPGAYLALVILVSQRYNSGGPIAGIVWCAFHNTRELPAAPVRDSVPSEDSPSRISLIAVLG